MRVASIVIAFALAGAALAAPPKPSESPDCRRTTAHVADQTGSYRGKAVQPRKLNQMPPGTAYMAVHRKIGGCEVPLTMVDYRAPKR